MIIEICYDRGTLKSGKCLRCGEESSEINPTTGWCIDCIEEERFYQETMRGL